VVAAAADVDSEKSLVEEPPEFSAINNSLYLRLDQAYL